MAVSELLFLYDCLTERPNRLEPIAARLGVTVQAISHTYRRLARRRLVELREGVYRPTVDGIAWLHSTLGAVAEDVFERQQRLRIIRSCRAVALARVRPGTAVNLELVDGVLSARPGQGGSSRGRTAAAAGKGDLVEVRDLEGILPIVPSEIEVLTIPAERLSDPGLGRDLSEEIRERPFGLLAAHGFVAGHLVGAVADRPISRFGAGPAALEASRLGVPATIFVLDEELPPFLAQFPAGERYPLRVRPVRTARPRRAAGPHNRQRTVIRKRD